MPLISLLDIWQLPISASNAMATCSRSTLTGLIKLPMGFDPHGACFRRALYRCVSMSNSFCSFLLKGTGSGFEACIGSVLFFCWPYFTPELFRPQCTSLFPVSR
jgi:hypothetical protein